MKKKKIRKALAKVTKEFKDMHTKSRQLSMPITIDEREHRQAEDWLFLRNSPREMTILRAKMDILNELLTKKVK